jgi:hypothetical protein
LFSQVPFPMELVSWRDVIRILLSKSHFPESLCTFMWGWMYSRRHPFLALPPRVGFIFTPLWSSGHWSVISLFHGFLHLLDVPARATWATILRNRSSFWHMTSWLMVGKISAFGSSTLIRQSFQFNLMFVILWNCRISRDSIHEFPLSLQLFKMS